MSMNASWIAILTAVTWCGVSSASTDVQLSTTFDEGTDGQLVTGEILMVPLFLQAGDDAALFGAELELRTATADVGIRSIALNPAFSAGPAAESAAMANRHRVTGIQPLAAMDPTLGTDGAEVHFATVELEVLSDQPFESALIVKARSALVGEIPDGTAVLGNSSGDDGWGEGRISVVNIRPADASLDTPMQPQAVDRAPWTVQQSAASLEIRSVGGLLPVAVLAPNTEYELHYMAGYASVNGFDLISTASSPDSAPTFDPACIESWDGLSILDLPSVEGPDEAGVRQVISGDIGPGDAEVPDATGPVGALCRLVTGSAGTLILDLRLYWSDPSLRLLVEMPVAFEFQIEGDADAR